MVITDLACKTKIFVAHQPAEVITKLPNPWETPRTTKPAVVEGFLTTPMGLKKAQYFPVYSRKYNAVASVKIHCKSSNAVLRPVAFQGVCQNWPRFLLDILGFV